MSDNLSQLGELQSCLEQVRNIRHHECDQYNTIKHDIKEIKASSKYIVSNHKVYLDDIISKIETDFTEMFSLLNKLEHAFKLACHLDTEIKNINDKLPALNDLGLKKCNEVNKLAAEFKSIKCKWDPVWARLKKEVEHEIIKAKKENKKFHTMRNVDRKKLSNFHPKMESPELKSLKKKIYDGAIKNICNSNLDLELIDRTLPDEELQIRTQNYVNSIKDILNKKLQLRTIRATLSPDEEEEFDTILIDIFNFEMILSNCKRWIESPKEDLWDLILVTSGTGEEIRLKNEVENLGSKWENAKNEESKIRYQVLELHKTRNKYITQFNTIMTTKDNIEKIFNETRTSRNKNVIKFDDTVNLMNE